MGVGIDVGVGGVGVRVWGRESKGQWGVGDGWRGLRHCRYISPGGALVPATTVTVIATATAVETVTAKQAIV